MAELREVVRERALAAFLLERVRAGYTIESHTSTQAVIVSGWGWSRLNPFRGASGRHAVSVDADGNVSMTLIAPRRW